MRESGHRAAIVCICYTVNIKARSLTQKGFIPELLTIITLGHMEPQGAMSQ